MSEPVSISVDEKPVFEGPLLLAAAANGKCFGGGMQIAPNAQIDDGWLDWVIIPELPILRVLGNLRSLYRGSHLHDARIVHGRGRVIDARGLAGPIRVDLDGESRGALPARFELLPAAITLWGCGG